MAKRKNTMSEQTVELATDGSGLRFRLIGAEIVETEEGVLTPAIYMTFDQAMEFAAAICHLIESECGEDPDQ